MATLGLTKLQAVNRILRAASLRPVTALDTGGTSEAADAEDLLDEVDVELQSKGWPENTVRAQSHTAADVGGGVYKITVASDTLDIRPVGADAHRTLVLNGDIVFDANQNTEDFGSAVVIYFDRVKELDFIDCSPKLKNLIAAEAARRYQQAFLNSPSRDQFLAERAALADQMVERNPTVARQMTAPLNPRPAPPLALRGTDSPDA